MTTASARAEIRVVHARNVVTSAEILEAAAQWGALSGRPSWRPGSFAGLESTGISRLRDDLERNSLFLVRLGNDAVATFSLLESDATFWPSAGDEALYLHRFAVRRSAAGCGGHAIAWSAEEAQRRRRDYIRLDCLAENQRIRRYYEGHGFAAVDERLIDEVRFSLYEMPVTAGAHSARPAGIRI
jgi:ribosomal protein S18 acetylase RimI-like enzyme